VPLWIFHTPKTLKKKFNNFSSLAKKKNDSTPNLYLSDPTLVTNNLSLNSSKTLTKFN
jgi:hypothetical protein